MSQLTFVPRFGLSALSAGVLLALLGLILGPAHPTQAALVEGGKGPQLLIGFDDDNQANALIQAGAVANQSLNRTDILDGGPGNDVMFGLNGNDAMEGGPGDDIILGGPDGGAAPGGPPNSDIMFGGPGNDVNLWAPGDGSEAFIGGPGLDAMIFGATDREAVANPATGVRLPTLFFGAGASTRQVKGGADVEDVKTIDVTASRFQFEPATISVAQGDNVRLRLHSADGTHGFAIKAFRVKALIPKVGEAVTVEFVADQGVRSTSLAPNTAAPAMPR